MERISNSLADPINFVQMFDFDCLAHQVQFTFQLEQGLSSNRIHVQQELNNAEFKKQLRVLKTQSFSTTLILNASLVSMINPISVPVTIIVEDCAANQLSAVDLSTETPVGPSLWLKVEPVKTSIGLHFNLYDKIKWIGSTANCRASSVTFTPDIIDGFKFFDPNPLNLYNDTDPNFRVLIPEQRQEQYSFQLAGSTNIEGIANQQFQFTLHLFVCGQEQVQLTQEALNQYPMIAGGIVGMTLPQLPQSTTLL